MNSYLIIQQIGIFKIDTIHEDHVDMVDITLSAKNKHLENMLKDSLHIDRDRPIRVYYMKKNQQCFKNKLYDFEYCIA